MIDSDSDYYKSQKEDAGEENGGWTNQMIEAFDLFLSSNPDISKISKILDLGCFTGQGIVAMRNKGYANIIGADLVKENIDKALSKGLNVIQADMHDLSIFADKEFDGLFMSHVIEHSTDPAKVLKECIRISKKGLIIFPIEPDKERVCNPPHYNTFRTISEVSDLITKCNFKLSKQTITLKKRLGEEVWFEYAE